MPFSWASLIIWRSQESKDWKRCLPSFEDSRIAPCWSRIACQEASWAFSPIRRLVERRLVDGVFEAADMHVVVDLLTSRLGVPVYSGVEDLHYAALVLGAQGFISNLASVFPDDCLALNAAFQSQEHLAARKIHERLVRLWRGLSVGTEREGRLRCALAARGRSVGTAKSPYGKLAPEAKQHIHSMLQKEGVLLEGR